jgi:hypothetical protein
MIKQIITKHNLLGQVKGALAEVANVAKKAGKEEASRGPPTVTPLGKAHHKQIRSDLHYIYCSLDAKLLDLQAGQSKLLSSVDSLNKMSENLQMSTKELKDKVNKVTDATDRITNTTMSYCDALLAKPANQNRTNTNPKVLSNLERKDKQVLIGYSSAEDNTTLSMSLLELKDKANQI